MRENKTLSLAAPIGIFGRGLSGRAAERLLRLFHRSLDQIQTFDEKSLPSGASLSAFLANSGFKTLIVSPGVPLSKPEIQKFRSLGGVVTSELEAAHACLAGERIITITGSVGKSTVAALLHEALKIKDSTTWLGGNFGFPLADYIADVIEDKRPRAKYLVLELSSYQLENFPSLSSDGTIITSLLANHLERYPDKSTYFKTKWWLATKTRGPVVLNKSGGELKSFLGDHPELLAGLHSQPQWTDHTDPKVPSWVLRDSPLLGTHNKDNLAVCYRLLHAMGLDSCAPGLINFRGLPHRVEPIAEIHGVRYINDSKATTMDSVLQAVKTVLESSPSPKKLILLLGGKDKNLPWQELKVLQQGDIQCLFFGEYGAAAKTKSELSGAVFSKLDEAITQASLLAERGDVVLLSPGGSSLDEFTSFEKRGDFFREKVLQLKPSP